MKRLFVCFGFATTLLLYAGCAQHDTNSPDTSGSAPYGAEGANKVGVDTVNNPQNQTENFPDEQKGTQNNMKESGAGGNSNGTGNRQDTIHRQQ